MRRPIFFNSHPLANVSKIYSNGTLAGTKEAVQVAAY